MEQTLTEQLRNIIESDSRTIRHDVAKEALDYHNPQEFFTDLIQSGCASGMVTSLIYYGDTHTFFDDHYDEIEMLRLEHDAQFGHGLEVFGDLRNFYAWFAFEEVARRIMSELDIGQDDTTALLSKS